MSRLVHHEKTPEQKGAAVLIPAYQPTDGLIRLCATLQADGHDVVVVDDGSGSEYDAVFSHLPEGVFVLRNAANQGKGNSLKTGLEYVYEHLFWRETVVTADADGQHEPFDIERVVRRQRETYRSIILGSRAFEGSVPLRSRFGNALTRLVFAVRTGVRLQDTQTGLRAFSTALIPDLLEIPGERYEYELNVLLWAADAKLPIVEVPARTVYIDDNASSHFRTVSDSIRVYSSILRFSVSSFVAFLLDFALVLLFAELLSGMATGVALLVSVVAARVISSSFNFLVNRHLVFRSSGRILAHAIGYYVLAAFVISANYSLICLGTIVVGMQLWLAKLLTEAALFSFSYAMQKRVVFR